jgi:hypothetical protein
MIILEDKIPDHLKDKLPVAISFVEGDVINVRINKDLKYAKSKFYNTQKMSCYNLNKPSFIKNNEE